MTRLCLKFFHILKKLNFSKILKKNVKVFKILCCELKKDKFNVKRIKGAMYFKRKKLKTMLCLLHGKVPDIALS